MSKLVLHLFHDDLAALNIVPAMADRLHQGAGADAPALEVAIFGPAEAALSARDRAEFNARIDGLVLR